MEFKPSWINVTYHRSETAFKKKADGSFEKVEVRKSPGTVGICAAIMNHYHIDAVPHIICGGFTKRETEDALIDLIFLALITCWSFAAMLQKMRRHLNLNLVESLCNRPAETNGKSEQRNLSG